MQENGKIATIFGGTGFIGTQIVREMAAKGWIVKVATRVPERAYFLKPCGTVGQVVPVACDYRDEASIDAAVKGSDYVVNCIGILYERKKSKFQRVQVDVPEMIAQACAKENVSRFVHISALGCDQCGSKRAKSKYEGEKAVRKAFPAATILRPSIVFGPEDDFFNMFAAMARYAPFLPLIGGGRTKFQPVYVGDVADAVMAGLTRIQDEKGPQGATYELGGPEIVTFRQVYERIFSHTGRDKMLVALPWGIAKVKACFLSLLPKPLLTPDQVESLKTDNVVSAGALKLQDLGIRAEAMDAILPSYMEQYQAGGRFSDKKRA